MQENMVYAGDIFDEIERAELLEAEIDEIGRASCRERVFLYI